MASVPGVDGRFLGAMGLRLRPADRAVPLDPTSAAATPQTRSAKEDAHAHAQHQHGKHTDTQKDGRNGHMVKDDRRQPAGHRFSLSVEAESQ